MQKAAHEAGRRATWPSSQNHPWTMANQGRAFLQNSLFWIEWEELRTPLRLPLVPPTSIPERLPSAHVCDGFLSSPSQQLLCLTSRSVSPEPCIAPEPGSHVKIPSHLALPNLTYTKTPVSTPEQQPSHWMIPVFVKGFLNYKRELMGSCVHIRSS